MTTRPLASLAGFALILAVPALSWGQAPSAAGAPAQPAGSSPPSVSTAPSATAGNPATTSPNATETPAAPTSTAERPATYTVESGDTLWSISHKFDTSIKALMKLNGLKKHALLHPGQVLKLPPADTTK